MKKLKMISASLAVLLSMSFDMQNTSWGMENPSEQENRESTFRFFREIERNVFYQDELVGILRRAIVNSEGVAIHDEGINQILDTYFDVCDGHVFLKTDGDPKKTFNWIEDGLGLFSTFAIESAQSLDFAVECYGIQEEFESRAHLLAATPEEISRAATIMKLSLNDTLFWKLWKDSKFKDLMLYKEHEKIFHFAKHHPVSFLKSLVFAYNARAERPNPVRPVFLYWLLDRPYINEVIDDAVNFAEKVQDLLQLREKGLESQEIYNDCAQWQIKDMQVFLSKILPDQNKWENYKSEITKFFDEELPLILTLKNQLEEEEIGPQTLDWIWTVQTDAEKLVELIEAQKARVEEI